MTDDKVNSKANDANAQNEKATESEEKLIFKINQDLSQTAVKEFYYISHEK